jgi:CubicO group peptidase (beta-lactamase class C family)
LLKLYSDSWVLIMKIAKKIIFISSIGFYSSFISCQNGNGGHQIDSAKIRKQEARIRKEIKADQKAKLIDEIFKKKLVEGFNGNVLIAQKGVIVYEKAFGYANFEDSIKNNLHSKFQLASLSKTFTAVAIMKLAEEGKIGLDYTVKDYFPSFPYDGVTIRSLLCHRSGLPFYQYTFDKLVRANEKYPTNQEMMEWFATANPTPPMFNHPDHFFSYNNTNYAILAAIVEKVSGLSFEQFMRQRIFLPLGMKESFIITSPNDSLNLNRTHGYQFGKRLAKDYYDDITGDKGVYSTVEDLLKWYNSIKNAKILSKESLKEMFLPRSFEYPGLRNYGYGFRLWVDAQQQTDYIYHTGWWKGYNTIMFFDLREDFVIILLSNKYNRTVYNIKDLIQIMHNGKRTTSMEENILDE